MINKISLVFLLSLIVFSCKGLTNSLYEMNKNKIFSSKEEIVDYFHSECKLDKDRLYFFDNESDKSDFLLNKTDVQALPYFGLFVSDSVKVKDNFIGDKKCIGVIDKFVLTFDGNKEVEPCDLRGYKLENYLDNPLGLNKDNPTLIFVISSNMGKTINVSANYVVDHIKKLKKPIDYVYIVIDPIF
jgi:hypothetical protein